MGKHDRLLGVAYNLADSIVSSTNLEFLRHIESFPREKTRLFEIDLLGETVVPEDLMTPTMGETIARYKRWFLSELEKLRIAIGDIERATVRIAYNPRDPPGTFYTCNATIRANGKEYTKKKISFH